jgi:hypothetical protein
MATRENVFICHAPGGRANETGGRLAGPIDVASTTAFSVLAAAATAFAACGSGAHGPAAAALAPAAPPPQISEAPPRPPDPDLVRPPPRRLLDIDWAKVTLTEDAAALAVWQQIAPTGADYEDKLHEIPATAARPLALAVLHGGRFQCAPAATGDCGPPVYDVPAPADAAGFDDPCLRRLLALWAIDQLDDDDAPALRPALLAIAALPAPESQLVAAAIHAVPEADQDTRLAILATAWRAGQRDLVGDSLGGLDEAHLTTAVRAHHIDAALDILPAEGFPAVFLAAIGDEALGARARTAAITELVVASAAAAFAAPGPGPAKLPPDLTAALVAATRAKDCSVAAAAARALDQRGDHRFVPRRPRTHSVPQLMRAMCVLASYEALLPNDEPSLVPGYVPARGLERMTIAFDPLSEDDPDGDGDPHTTHTAELVPRAEVVLPELDDLVRAMQHCTGTICVSDDHEFRFVFRPFGGETMLSQIELADRPPCTPAAGATTAKP